MTLTKPQAGNPVVNFEQVARAVFGEPWAITPEMYATICGIVAERMTGYRPSADEIQERLGAIDRQTVPRGASKAGTIAVLPLLGVISQRANMMSAMSGGTSTEQFGQAFNAAVADSSISAIVLDVDSPGGSIKGVTELHQTIMAARGAKPIVAVANSLMASAAYWISAAADEIVASPSAEVGSIGVVTQHADMSAKLEQEGVKVTTISAGRKKASGDPTQPLSEEALGDIQDRVNEVYGVMTADIAKGRGVGLREVRNGYGEGGLLSANLGLSAGMVDRVATLDQTLERLMGSGPAGPASTGRRTSAARRAARQ